MRVQKLSGWVILAAAAGFSGVPQVFAAKSESLAQCFLDLAAGRSETIICEFPLQPSAAERAEMEQQTSGLLKDAACVVSINIARSLIKAAVDTPDHIFQAPPQPVSCRITTPGKVADTVTHVTGTFAPKVTFKGGVAVDATPGLSDVQGISRILSMPASAYINRAGFLRQGMLKAVNAWVEHLRRVPSKVVSR